MRTAPRAALFLLPLWLFAALFLFPVESPAKGSAPQEEPKTATPAPPKKVQAKINYLGSFGLQVAFTQPVWDISKEDAAKKMSPEDMPITFTPHLDGEGQWVDARNFHFTTYKELPRATTITATVKENSLTGLNGAVLPADIKMSITPYPFSFQANQVRYTVDGTVTLALDFSCRVDFAKLKTALSITDQKGEKLPMEFSTEKDRTTGYQANVFVKPAELGEVTVSLPEGFTSEAGPMGLTKARSNVKVKTTSMFTINTVRPSQSSSPPWERYIEVRTTNSADMDKVKQFMEITPATDVSIVARSNGFLITGDFITRPRVNVTFKKGMTGMVGALLEDHTTTVVFNDFSPRMAFDTEGSILSPNRAMKLPISSINVEKVQATLWQVPESNIPLMAMGFFDSYKKHLSRKIAVRTGAVNAVRNRSADFSLDLNQIAGKAKGVFLLTVSDASDPKKVRSDEPRDPDPYGDYYDEYYYDDDVASPMEKLVVISDIGITARTMSDGITVWANSIATAEALENARVRVFAQNNVLIAEGRTDKDGLWRHDRTEDWGAHERPAIVVVSTATKDKQPKAEPGLAEASVTDLAFLKLENNLAGDSSFDTGGRDYVRQGYEAYCFTPRGIFRPGETVDFKVMVRDSRMRAPKEFPIAWQVKSSTGRTVGSGTAMLTADGGAAFSLPLVPSAPTGRYSMIVSLPGQGRTIGYCAFSVEDFQPPRIEVKLTSEEQFVVNGPISIAVDAKYLFGSPVADAPWEHEYSVSPGAFRHPEWRSFYFPSYFSKSMSQIRDSNSGTLDDEGKTELTITPDENWTGSILNVVSTVRVREDGGRWVGRTHIMPWYKNSFLLGYEYPKEDPQAGAPCSMRFAAVTPDGKPVTDIKELDISIERSEYYYVRTDRGYTQAHRYVPVAKSQITLENGIGTLTFTPPRQANYSIKASAKGVEAMETNLYVWSGVAGTDDGASPIVDRVMLSWERPKYKVGETAMLKVRSPFPGKLLLVLEGETEVYRMVLPLTETETTVPVPVMEGMLPNAYCSAWVIRPVLEDERWGAHRAYGLIPMLIDRAESKLNVEITSQAAVLPKTEMPVSITVTDANGKPVRGEVTLALVDEGLLSLTNFRTPDPFGFFTAKRSLRSQAYDLYNDLMPLSARKAITLQAGGGGAGDDSHMSPMTRKLELLSIFLGTLTTDSNGVATTTLTLPEYSGRGRLMAIAATTTGVGSSDGNVRIARDVTVEATVPRMVAPGDTFAMPVIAFGDGKKAVKATVTIETDGPLAVQGEKTFTISLDEKTTRAPLDLTVKALDASGLAAVRVITAIEGSDEKPFEQRLEIPVRPPFPRLTRNGGGIIKGGEKAAIDVGGGFYPGTQRVALSFSDTPGISLMKALDYLGSYPYGCLEQTTSSAWPYLAVPAMLKSIDPEKANDSEFRQALDFAVRRILSMQRYDGGFNGWPGMNISSAYAWTTIYATHFLTEAKSSGLVPADALKSSLEWMRSYLSSSLPENNWAIMDALSVKAYACYVLALNGDAPLGWMQFLSDQGKFLTQSARIFIAGAYAVATGKPDALRELGTQPLADSSRYGWSLESSPRNEALRLLMWTHVDPFAPEAALLAKRVMDNGNAGYWRSTQENAMAVMAIGRYIEKTAGASREFAATLTARNDTGAEQEIAAFTNKDKPTFSRKNLLPAEPAAPAPITASIEGEGTAYYSWTTSGVPVEAPAPFAEGIDAIRRWVLPDGTVYDFIPDKDGNLPEALQNLKIPHGTRVTVTLYVKPKAAMNSMVLADIVPGGFEIDNPNLVPDSEYAARSGTFIDPKTGKAFPAPEGYKNAYSLNNWIEGRTEMRDDRLLLFVDYMYARSSAFTYTLRAVNKGEFVLPPLSVEDMYDPSIRALTNTAKVTVE